MDGERELGRVESEKGDWDGNMALGVEAVEKLSLLDSILCLAHWLAGSVFSLLSIQMKLVVARFPWGDFFFSQKCARLIAR